jgi:hypothetical protein
MAFCNNCGREISDHASTCPECGHPQKSAGPVRSSAVDTGGFGWGLLGFCIPIVGIILYFVWKLERPNTAKVLLQGALISIGLSIFLNVVAACVGGLGAL